MSRILPLLWTGFGASAAWSGTGDARFIGLAMMLGLTAAISECLQ
jgi:hypothetical protein